MMNLMDAAILHNCSKKGCGYIPFLEKHLAPIKEKPIHLLEFGVFQGASMKMWKDYFPVAQITGVDIQENCRSYIEDRIEIVIGDLNKPEFRTSIKSMSPDVIIDDAGHTMEQQKTLLAEFFPIIKSGGLYIVEDLHTSFWPQFGGGGPGTTANYLGSLAAEALHWEANKRDARSPLNGSPLTYMEEHLQAMYFYPCLCILEKK